MRRSRITILITVLLAVSVLLLIASPALAGEKYTLPRNEYAPAAPDPLDGTHMLGAKDKALRKLAAQIGTENLISPTGVPAAANAEIGDDFTISVSDMGDNSEYNENFVVVAVGEHGIICIPDYAYESFDAVADPYYHFPNPNGSGSDSWTRTEDLLTPAQLDYLLGCFDTTIWDTMDPIFGTPLSRPSGDLEDGQKVWILIHNIQDEAYYDPAEETYVAGYFSSSEDTLAQKNMMHIDTYDWANRTGANAERPFLYEGVFAHEYQHLLHFDMDPDEESWVDEGLADLAAFLCGYGEDNSHVVYYLVYHPLTPLTFFGGGLESYGASYLFQLYLWEKYGGDTFTKSLFENQANGIEGVQNALDDSEDADGISFDKVFDNWTIANYLDDPNRPLFGYDSLNIGTADTWGYSIEYALQRYWYPSHRLKVPLTLSAAAFWGGAPQPYTAQYYSFNNQKSLTAMLDGTEEAGVAAHSGGSEWCSGQGTWAWKSFSQSFAIPTTGASLNFWTYYEIEDGWDYGYVEVFDQDTGEWTTLAGTDDLGNPLTTDTLPQVQDNPNVPEGREPMDYVADGEWNAFTGNSGGWVHVNMDLAPFAGDNVTIYFRTWQDGAFTLQMMYVDDIEIPELGFADDLESGTGGWTSPDVTTDPDFPDTDGWSVGDGLEPNNWQGTLIETLWDTTTRYSRGHSASARNYLFYTLLDGPWSIDVDADTQSGSLSRKASVSNQSKLNWVYIVSNRANHILGSDCMIGATK
jgi:hypothetical protein